MSNQEKCVLCNDTGVVQIIKPYSRPPCYLYGYCDCEPGKKVQKLCEEAMEPAIQDFLAIAREQAETKQNERH